MYALMFRRTITFHLLSEAVGTLMSSIPGSRNLLSSTCPSVSRKIQSEMPLQAIIGLLVLAIGGIVRALSIRHLGQFYTWETAIFKEHKLVTSGPFAVVRHPAYTGALLTMVGYDIFALAPRSLAKECLLPGSSHQAKSLLFLLYISLYIFCTAEAFNFLARRSASEDVMMKKEFKEQWVDWSKKVHWRLFPFVL
jgi:protein-S-isoprenylcysteine O-methyltransferase Ste14